MKINEGLRKKWRTVRSEEHTSELQSQSNIVCRLLLEKKKQQRSERAADRNAIRPFQVNVRDADLTELRRRIEATRWPERETVADASQGVQLATMQKLARYWATEYDWRKVEARLNSFPQFITEVDGLYFFYVPATTKIYTLSLHDALPI